jgi:molybdate transport system substrate-binding protein
MKKTYLILSVAAIAIIIIAAYTLNVGYLNPASEQERPELRIFVASSLVNVVANQSAAFEQENNCKVTVNIGGSNGLFQQITSGSPCDVFMSADSKWTMQLQDLGFLRDDTYYNFTANTLTVLLPSGNPADVTSLLDLVKPGVKIVMTDLAVPAGSYANKTLTKIDATWGNSASPQYKGPEWANYKERFLANVVSYETKVEDVVGKVALGLGTVDAGVAFASDATYGTMTGATLQFVEIPASVNTKGIYGIAVLASSSNPDLAAKYMNYWLSTDGQALLSTYGFGA